MSLFLKWRQQSQISQQPIIPINSMISAFTLKTANSEKFEKEKCSPEEKHPLPNYASFLFEECSKQIQKPEKKKIAHSKYMSETPQQFLQHCSTFLTSKLQDWSQEEKEEKKRKDQNRCKKIHSLVLKIMKRMNIYSSASPYKKENFRLDYFIILLMLIQKQHKLEEFQFFFSSIVRKAVETMKQETKDMKNVPPKLKTYILTLQNYIKVVHLFMECRLEESLNCLFDMPLLRNTTFIGVTYRRMQQLYQEILGEEVQLGKNKD